MWLRVRPRGLALSAIGLAGACGSRTGLLDVPSAREDGGKGAHAPSPEAAVDAPRASRDAVAPPVDARRIGPQRAILFGPARTCGGIDGRLRDRLILTGGCCTPADTWAWDGGSWTMLNVTSPPTRSQAVMATLGKQLLLFGGYPNDASGVRQGDTWAWDGTTWTELDVPGPTARTIR
jgi:hypothetical protein